MTSFAEGIKKGILNFIEEEWDIETLKENPNTSGENESSVVLYSNISNGILLMGDAGIGALTRACDYADISDIDLRIG